MKTPLGFFIRVVYMDPTMSAYRASVSSAGSYTLP